MYTLSVKFLFDKCMRRPFCAKLNNMLEFSLYIVSNGFTKCCQYFPHCLPKSRHCVAIDGFGLSGVIHNTELRNSQICCWSTHDPVAHFGVGLPEVRKPGNPFGGILLGCAMVRAQRSSGAGVSTIKTVSHSANVAFYLELPLMGQQWGKGQGEGLSCPSLFALSHSVVTLHSGSCFIPSALLTSQFSNTKVSIQHPHYLLPFISLKLDLMNNLTQLTILKNGLKVSNQHSLISQSVN
jgi:hypothetical protein